MNMHVSLHRQLDALLRNDLVAFTQKAFAELTPGRRFEPSWHHEAMAYQLGLVTSTRELLRLIINVPPRSLKSMMATVALPAFLLGRDPTLKIITVCYGQDLANGFSRQTRQIMRSEWYQRLFPSTRIDGQGAETWFRTTAGGFRMATSIEGTLTGRGGDLIIIDDPQKAGEALSVTRRDAVHKWTTETLFTRLDDKIKGGIILVQQRLHEDDLSGRLLDTRLWARLKVPVIAVEDESICLGRFPSPRFHKRIVGDLLDGTRQTKEILDSLKREMGTAAFVAQYQQDPLPPEGDLINVLWFQRYRDLPFEGRVVLSIDTAVKSGERNDWSVITCWRLDDGRYYLVSVWRRRVDYPELKACVIEHANRLNPDTILIEDKGTGSGLIQELQQHDQGYPVVAYNPGTNDKVTRMSVQSSKIEGGLVYLPTAAPWLDDYLDEFRRFPNGKHDDQVDATSQLLDWATNKQPGRMFVLQYRS